MDERTRVLVRLAASLTGTDEAQRAAMDRAAEEAAAAAEEVLLQSYLFLGYPAALNALGLWRRRTGRPAPAPRSEDPTEWAERGAEVCRKVYAGQYHALRELMAGIHPELDTWAVVEGYGKVLGRPGLALKTRELCIAAQLAGVGPGASRQLHAHLRGCLNVGATVAEVEATLDAVDGVVDADRLTAARAVWRRVRDQWLSKQQER